jgi:hypothetical protein
MNNINEKLENLEDNLISSDNTIRKGRPKNNKLTEMVEGVNMKELNQRVQLVRARKRTPLSEQRRLMSFDQEEGYTYRLVNDTFDRIPKFEQAGWVIVDRDGKEIDPDVRMQDSNWKQRARSQPVGEGKTGYMMKIPTKWYQEDVQRQQTLIDERESSFKSAKRIRDEKNSSYEAYGEVKIGHSLNRKS